MYSETNKQQKYLVYYCLKCLRYLRQKRDSTIILIVTIWAFGFVPFTLNSLNSGSLPKYKKTLSCSKQVSNRPSKCTWQSAQLNVGSFIPSPSSCSLNLHLSHTLETTHSPYKYSLRQMRNVRVGFYTLGIFSTRKTKHMCNLLQPLSQWNHYKIK